METGLLIIVIIVFAYAVFAARLSNTVVTAPMIFLALGYGLSTFGLLDLGDKTKVLYLVAELALIVVLFFDASQVNVKALIKDHLVPQRMLFIGIPLMIIIGTIVSIPFFPDWSIYALLLLASILAPTDAALGQAVVTNKQVPEPIRRTLIVESGINDGLALPLVLFFAAIIATQEGGEQQHFLIFLSKQLILGPLVGITIGFVGAKIILWTQDRKYSNPVYEGIATLGVAILTYLAAELVGGNGFIAAFVAGLTFGQYIQGRIPYIEEFGESGGQMLVWAAFFLIGNELLPNAISSLTLPMAGIILLSLFVIRPLAIYLSLIGSNTDLKTRLVLGWFGPRGLGTALYALLVVNEMSSTISYGNQILTIAINAVWISALLHGLSAAPWSGLYEKSEKN